MRRTGGDGVVSGALRDGRVAEWAKFQHQTNREILNIPHRGSEEGPL